jgi:hypothetical protein
MKMGTVGGGVNAIIEQCAVNDLAVERKAHTDTRAQLLIALSDIDHARAELRPAFLKGVLVGAVFGALPFLGAWAVFS